MHGITRTRHLVAVKFRYYLMWCSSWFPEQNELTSNFLWANFKRKNNQPWSEEWISWHLYMQYLVKYWKSRRVQWLQRPAHITVLHLHKKMLVRRPKIHQLALFSSFFFFLFFFLHWLTRSSILKVHSAKEVVRNIIAINIQIWPVLNFLIFRA